MSLHPQKSIVARILFYVLPPCVVLFLVSLSIFYVSSKRTIEEMTHRNAELITERTVLRTEQVLKSIEKITENNIWLLENGELDEADIEAFTSRIVRDNLEILGCAVAYAPDSFSDPQKAFTRYSYRHLGRITSRGLDNETYAYSLQDWYQLPATLERACWVEPYFDTGGADALISTYAVPFYRRTNGKKEFAGVFAIDVSLDWLTSIVSSVRILDTGYAALISRNGTFVTHEDKDLIMNQTIFSYAAELESLLLREIGRDMQAGNRGFATIRLQEVDWVIAYMPMPSNNWILAVVFPKAEMYAPLRRITLILVVLLVVGLGLLSFIVIRMVTHQLAPLHGFTETVHKIAGGDFDVPLPDIRTEDEMRDLHDSFARMQCDLKEYISNLQLTTSAKEKIESELRIAREIQMGMIPKIFPPFPNLNELDLFAILEPAKEVGGDLYDFFLLDESHLCVAVGDVSGKGVPASLFMAVTRTLLRSIGPRQSSPAAMVSVLNRSLSQNNESSMFVTFFLAILDLQTGQLKYTNAGHNPPVWLHAGGTPERFDTAKNIPVGLFEEHAYGEHECTLLPGDGLFFYTDGVTEAENAQKELFSDERLMQCLGSSTDPDPRKVIECVRACVDTHVAGNEQSDDLTMLSLIYYGNSHEKHLQN
ncbi:MAG: SpoIIE family protein phosphatase [Opitutales bacterium]|nr:SpoIIE family protein phosphatase [Opitutales bacterium]